MKYIILLFALLPMVLFGQNFTLSSPTLSGQMEEAQVFNAFGCTGDNVSPELTWKDAPEGTKSFAITMYDPDAPTGSGWWHWLVFDIPANVRGLKAGAGDAAGKLMPKGAVQSLTDYGAAGYGGPCPPVGHGPHQYIITIYALQVDQLGLDAAANPAKVGYYINSNALAKASVVAYFERK